jgi:hypothetical protein
VECALLAGWGTQDFFLGASRSFPLEIRELPTFTLKYKKKI